MNAQPEINYGQRYLVKYYTQVLSMLCTTTVLGNSFVNVFVPMAIESPTVLRSLLAFSASHLSGFQGDYQMAAIQYESMALQSLATDLHDPSKRETNLASCLLLIPAVSPSNQWFSHMEGAKAIIDSAVGRGPGGKTFRGVEYFSQSQDGQWLLRDFSYHDVIGAVAMGREPLIKGKYWIPHNRQILDAFTGLGSGIFGLLSDICCLKKPSHDDDVSDREGMTYRSWQEFSDIEFELLAWTCGEGQPEDLVDLSECQRLASLVCLYRKAREFFPHEAVEINAEIARNVRELIRCINKLPYQSVAEGGVIFPVFIAGGDAPDEESIATIRARMRGLLGHRGFKHIRLALDVLEEMWRLRQRGVKQPNGLDICWRDIVDRRGIKLMLF